MPKVKLIDNYVDVEIEFFDCKNLPIRINIPKVIFEDNTNYDEIKNFSSVESIINDSVVNFAKDCGVTDLDTIKAVNIAVIVSAFLNTQKFLDNDPKLVKYKILGYFQIVLWVVDDIYDSAQSDYNKIKHLFKIISNIMNGKEFDNNDTFLLQNKNYLHACTVVQKFKQELDDFVTKSKKDSDVNFIKNVEQYFIQDYQVYLDSVDWDVRRRSCTSKNNYVYPEYELSVLHRHGSGGTVPCFSLSDIVFNAHNISGLPRIATMINLLDHFTSLSIIYLNDVVSTNREVKTSVSESEFQSISIDCTVKELPIGLLAKIPIDTVMSRSYNHNISLKESVNIQLAEYEKSINTVVQLYNEIQDCLTINDNTISDDEQAAILFRVYCSAQGFPNWTIFHTVRYGVKPVKIL